MMHGVQKINIDLKLRQKHAPIFTCTAKLKGLVKPIRTCNRVQIPYAEATRTAQRTRDSKNELNGRERALPTFKKFRRKRTGVLNIKERVFPVVKELNAIEVTGS